MNSSGKRSTASVSRARGASRTSSLSAKSAARLRRAAPSIDTNIGLYDRKDPFQAFNALLKLLGSLPSRIGGCQFKLTPEEHKLSLHLLNIVEPFVGSSPSRRTLITRQPTEILDAIMFHVDSKQDLLNVALSCQRMHSVVFPRHFEYRVVKCKVSAVSVWNHLNVHRSLAKNVRRLEVLDERCLEAEVVPSGILTSDTDLESTDDELGMHAKQEKFLVAALGRMTHLTSFEWNCNHAPISIDNVWPTLMKCQSLREVVINDNLVFSPADEESEQVQPSVMPELKTVSLRSTRHAYGSSKHPELSRIKGMLNSCPNLESLDIMYTQPRTLPSAHLSADDLFLFGRWPNLTSLTLTNLRCSPFAGLDAASTFFSTHLNLEVLHLDLSAGTSNKLVFPPNALPKLRELKASKEVASAILGCPSEVLRPLETIKGVRLAGSYSMYSDADRVFFGNLKQFGVGIKRIELVSWNEMEDVRRLVESAPRLVWLDLGKKGQGQGQGSNANLSGTHVHAGPSGKGSHLPTVNANVVEWATLLSSAPELTTFHGIKFFYEVSAQAAAAPSIGTGSSGVPPAMAMTDRSRIRKNDEIASVLAWKCPKLRRLDHWDVEAGKVVVLVKDGEKDKVKWEVRRVKQ